MTEIMDVFGVIVIGILAWLYLLSDFRRVANASQGVMKENFRK